MLDPNLSKGNNEDGFQPNKDKTVKTSIWLRLLRSGPSGTSTGLGKGSEVIWKPERSLKGSNRVISLLTGITEVFNKPTDNPCYQSHSPMGSFCTSRHGAVWGSFRMRLQSAAAECCCWGSTTNSN